MIRLLLTEVAPGAAEEVRVLLAAQEEIEVLGYPRDGLEAAQMAVRLKPDVLLVHERLPEMSGMDACELVSLAAPEVACAVLCDQNDAPTLRRAMRAGARAVLTPYSSVDDLLSVLRDLSRAKTLKQQREYQLAVDPAAMPQTIALLSARDGVGKSTIAVNLATALAQRFPRQTVLVDLYGQFGSAALLLNIKPDRTVVDLAGFANDMDIELVETFLETHPSGVRVLPGGARPDPVWTDALSVTFLSSLLGILRRRYRFIILDTPTLIWPGSLYAITRAQCVLLIASLSEVTAVREAAALVAALTPAHVPPERLHLVVNQVAGHTWFTEDDARSATRQPVWHTVPHDPQNVFSAANEGAPVVTAKPNSVFSKNMLTLADKLVRDTAAAT